MRPMVNPASSAPCTRKFIPLMDQLASLFRWGYRTDSPPVSCPGHPPLCPQTACLSSCSSSARKSQLHMPLSPTSYTKQPHLQAIWLSIPQLLCSHISKTLPMTDKLMGTDSIYSGYSSTMIKLKTKFLIHF